MDKNYSLAIASQMENYMLELGQFEVELACRVEKVPWMI